MGGATQLKKKINSRIKFREKFRPFAPAILYSYAKNFGIKKEYPYMTIACFPENSLKTKMLEAVHEDGSTRIQTVREKSHPLFELLTNIYLLVILYSSCILFGRKQQKYSL